LVVTDPKLSDIAHLYGRACGADWSLLNRFRVVSFVVSSANVLGPIIIALCNIPINTASRVLQRFSALEDAAEKLVRLWVCGYWFHDRASDCYGEH
jgi:hypothetical protein